MRQLILLSIVSFMFITHHSFAQNSNNIELESVKLARFYVQQISQQQSAEDKLIEFYKLKKQIRLFFESIPNPEKTFFLGVNHPISRNVTSMAEFEGYLDMVNINKITKESRCNSEANTLVGYARPMKEDSELSQQDITKKFKELYWAQAIIRSLCN